PSPHPPSFPTRRSSDLSNFANMAACFDKLGADGLVSFNRFYQPDIDLKKMEIAPNLTLSTPADMRLPLHWIGILYGKIRANLARSEEHTSELQSPDHLV